MVVDLKFSKFNDTPWGFRLTGGADFDFPLTVIKVTEGSLAAQAGMQLGDVVVRINDTPASSLSHLEAHNVLLAAGNNFMLGVIRENEQDAIAAPDESVTIGNPAAEVPALPANIQEQTIIEEPTQEAIEEKLMDVVVTDDQIAEVISSEAEVLKEHNVIGVNFNKIIPQALSLKTSEVFKTLNAQAVQTKEEKVQEERKWTTFLQKPNRPIPKSKWDIEQEKRESYKVKIVKQPKPRIAPDRVATPPPMMIQPDSPKEEPERVPETNESAEQPLPSQSDAPEEEEIDLQAEEVVELVASTADDEVPDLEEPQVQAEPENPDELPRELEEKLADVQRQLLSLSNLPHAIQATLDAVTEQLSKIVPATKEEIQEDPTECQEDVRQEITAEERGENEVSLEDQEVSEIHREIEEELVSPEPVERGQEISEIMNEDVQDMEQETEEDLDHQQRLIGERTPKRPPKPKLTSVFGPLVPQERPIFLPGGRKWRKPKDAFNDEFIAEVLSSQAELIIGTTLGNTYESPLLPYDDRVNFLKYQKPEKKVDLRNSEVYRMIHRMDKEPTHGIAVRPEKVLTADDVHRSSPPVAACGQ